MTNVANSYLGLMAELNQRNAAPAPAPPRSMKMEIDDNVTEGYDELFDPPVSSIMECPVCLLVLRDAVQTACGHRFCKNCILKVLREGRKACPVDNEPLEESQIFPDTFARREIQNYTVHCRNYNERGCDWLGPLLELPSHLKVCLFEYVPCTNNCDVEVLRCDLEKHLKEDCLKRIEACRYCSIKVVFKNLEDHHSTCNEFPIFCPNNCSQDTIIRKNLEDHLQNHCPKARVHCPFKDLGCSFEGRREEVDAHFNDSFKSHVADLVKVVCKLKENVDKDVVPVRSIQQASAPELAQKLLALQEKVNELALRVGEAAEKGNQGVQLAELYYSTQNTAISKIESSIRDLTARLDVRDVSITELQAKIWNGHFVWKIVNFDKLFKQATTGEVPAIHSVPFYTGIPGYKMCLRVNLNGVDSGASTHISMFIHLMQGEFDNFLPWPFPGKITLMAVDQSENDPLHVTETLVARPGLQAFLRPKTARNHKGYGYVEMISHAVLRTREYLKNNSLIVYVTVTTTD